MLEVMVLITKEEAQHLYNKSMQEYDEARRGRSSAEYKKGSYESQKKSEETSLASSKLEKKNLEARLADIKVIISLLEHNVPSYISKANRAAETAGEKYVSAIKCSSITNASIQDAYYSKRLEEDVNSANAYHRCLDEQNRLEMAIENLSSQIQTISNKIDLLDSRIRSAASAYSIYDDEMKSCKSKINYYYSYI